MTQLEPAVRAVLDKTWDAIVVTEATPIDAASGGPAIVYVNAAFCRMTGYEPSQVVGRTPRLLQGPDTDREVLDRIRSALASWQPVEAEVLNVRADGTSFWVQLGISPLVGGDGEYTHWLAVQRDVTDRHRAQVATEQSLRTATGHLTSAFGDAPIGMAVTTPAGVLLRVNPALCQLLGRSDIELLGRDLFAITHPDDLTAARSACASLSREGRRLSRVACRLRHSGGRYLSAQITTSCVADKSGAPVHLVMHVQDVTDQAELHAQLSHQALHDALTGLANRTLFLDRLNQALRRARRDRSTLGVLFVDIDHFKSVNDTLGHRAGDRALGIFAQRLTNLLRPGDTAARMGGDEFAVLAENIDQIDAGRIADRLAAAIEVPFECESETVRLSVSTGIVIEDGSGTDADIVLRNADIAMYSAKITGRARHVTFDTGMHAQIVERRRLESELIEAIDAGQLDLYYQPVIDLASGQVQAVEALLRWHHPDRGLLLPGAFVPVAEDSDLIVDLGRWVLDAAAAQTRRWLDRDTRARAEAEPTIAAGGVTWINVSARELTSDLLDHLRHVLERHSLPPGCLGLEITESALMSDLPAVRPLLEEIKKLGARLAIDDFGTGYSSLAYLAKLPVDTVKVDQSFVEQLGPGGNGAAVITAVLALAESLGVHTVVEGAETAAQLAALRNLGVTTAQGYHLGPPAPASSCAPPGQTLPLDRLAGAEGTNETRP